MRENWKMLIDTAVKKKIWLSTAESCTGGLISSRITDVPGASECFKGGVVSYSNWVKIEVLGVQESTLREYGAVSRECAREMSRGAMRVLGSDLSVAVTGIAGPGGGTREKPVGTVYISVRSRDGYDDTRLFHLEDLSRDRFKVETASRSLRMLIDALEA
ncbi:MAG: nicotinamide-nucleotide amidohydrolase family protein [Thermoplasmatota archaeon]